MSAPSLRLRGSLAVAATALLVTACGSSSSGAAAAGSSAAPAGAAATSAAAAATTSQAAATSAAAGAAATSGSNLTIAPTQAAVTSVKATGGGDFCKSLASAINSNSVTAGGTTPADLKASIQKSLKVGLEALGKAPSAIRPDVKILIDASAQLFAALEKDNYDFTKITPADEAAMTSPAVVAAEKRVNAYVKADCGIDIGAGAAASSS